MLKSRDRYRRAIKILNTRDRSEGWVNNVVHELLDSIVLFPNSPARYNLPQMVEEILKSGRKEVIQVDLIRGRS